MQDKSDDATLYRNNTGRSGLLDENSDDEETTEEKVPQKRHNNQCS